MGCLRILLQSIVTALGETVEAPVYKSVKLSSSLLQPVANCIRKRNKQKRCGTLKALMSLPHTTIAPGGICIMHILCITCIIMHNYNSAGCTLNVLSSQSTITSLALQVA